MGHVNVHIFTSFIPIREQQKKLSSLEMELSAARQEGFVPKFLTENNATPKKRPLAVIGILTGFGRKSNRDAIRKAWMGTGMALVIVFSAIHVSFLYLLSFLQSGIKDGCSNVGHDAFYRRRLKHKSLYPLNVLFSTFPGNSMNKMESEKGIIVRFIIGRRCAFPCSLVNLNSHPPQKSRVLVQFT